MRLSVAMATFDGVGYIDEQILSILAQTRRVDEIVIADDGSTDGTLEQLEFLHADAERAGIELRVILGGGRLGVTANFQRAIAATSGDLVFLSDQDDVWHADRVAAAIEALPTGVLLQHADAELVDGAGHSLGRGLFEALRLDARERREIDSGHPLGVYLRRNLATGAVTMFRRELLAAATPFPPEWVHDEWLAMIAAASSSIQVFERRLIDYRQHGQNQIGVAAPGSWARLLRMLQPRGDRYSGLADRARVLERRLGELDVPAHVMMRATGKRAFEEARARYPARRAARLLPILRRWARGDYRDYSSQRSLDVIRDFIQPA